MCVVLAACCVAAGAEFENPKAGAPPAAKPQRRSGAEGVPPLPLPATPLRRTERKRQPAPPALVGMVNFPATRFEIVEGRRVQADAFPTTQIDIERLMNYANNVLSIRYRYQPITLESFSWDPAELPLLYLTGWTEMPELPDALVAKLNRYLMDGGTLVIHAQCGRAEFVDSARRQIARILPNRPLAPVDGDSPLFHAAAEITQMRVRTDNEPFKTMPAYIEAVYLGCRPAIIFSPIDLNCGWDVVNRPIIGGILYHQDDALKLGVNIIATTLANLQYARTWGRPRVYPEQGDDTRDRLVIAQVAHGGDYDPTPHGLLSLLKYIQQNTTLNVQFTRRIVEPDSVDVFAHPVLYMTGLRDFTLTDAQVQRLRSYLNAGGFLIADAAAGNKAFDAAFRREIARVLPERRLELLAADSPLYKMPNTIGAVDYTPLARAQLGDLRAPVLEGITIEQQLAVVYSPLGLASGWEQLGYAFNRGYADADAIRLGVNIIAYALTH